MKEKLGYDPTKNIGDTRKQKNYHTYITQYNYDFRMKIYLAKTKGKSPQVWFHGFRHRGGIDGRKTLLYRDERGWGYFSTERRKILLNGDEVYDSPIISWHNGVMKITLHHGAVIDHDD